MSRDTIPRQGSLQCLITFFSSIRQQRQAHGGLNSKPARYSKLGGRRVNAPYTPRQLGHFDNLREYGGVIVGKNGVSLGLSPGTRIGRCQFDALTDQTHQMFSLIGMQNEYSREARGQSPSTFAREEPISVG